MEGMPKTAGHLFHQATDNSHGIDSISRLYDIGGEIDAAQGGMRNMAKVVYVDFQKRSVVPEGFCVEKERDMNVIYQKHLTSIRTLLKEKKWELPQGPNCPGDEECLALATDGGCLLYDESEQGKRMTAVFEHVKTCERCEALCRKTVLETKLSRRHSKKDDDDR
jgi:hypothetical protein